MEMIKELKMVIPRGRPALKRPIAKDRRPALRRPIGKNHQQTQRTGEALTTPSLTGTSNVPAHLREQF